MAKLNLSGIWTIWKLVLSSHPFTPMKIRSSWRVSMEVPASTREATKIICASPLFMDEIIHRRTSDR